MSVWYDLKIEYPEHGVITTTRSTNWEDSMITGNGTIGVIVPGHTGKEQLGFCHERLYLPYNPPLETVTYADRIDEFRRMIESGRADECSQLMWELSGLEELIWTDPFVPAFQLDLEIKGLRPETGSYLRKTDYGTGTVTTCFETEDNRIRRDCFVSRADKIAVIRITAENPFECSVSPSQVPVSDKELAKKHAAVIDTVDIQTDQDVMTFAVRYKNQWPGRPSGFCASIRTHITPTRVLILVAIDVQCCPETVKPICPPDLCEYDTLLQRHAALHGRLYDRVTFSLPGSERIEQTFDAARYTIISCTGDLPPNLQGIWTGTWTPPWSGDFTMNGNVNTAVAFGLNGNLPEVTRALCTYLERLVPDFRINARNTFGCNGFLASGRASNHGMSIHFNKNFPHNFWMAGNGWYAQYFFDYWQYTQDECFLTEHAIPFMLEAATFYEEVVYRVNEQLRFCPSYSPENTPANQKLPLSYNATMDIAAMKELFRNLLSLRERPEIPKERARVWEELLAVAPPYMLDTTGAFKEWLDPEIEEKQEHRHASQLYPLFHEPDPEILANPELQKGCKKTIDKRLDFRRGSNGGDMAFGLYQLAQASANLKDTALAEECINWMTRSYWSPVSTCFHNPGKIFNVDICGGLPAAIIHMLLQSSLTHIELLPVLPDSWPDGSIKGICARGGLAVDITWQDGKLKYARLCSNNDRSMYVRYRGLSCEFAFQAGKAITLDATLTLL